MAEHNGAKDETIVERPEFGAARREALAKMGRLAGYTEPAMLGLLGVTNPRVQVVASGLCALARAVYGPDNPAWLEFRTWLLGRAPAWLRCLYIACSPRVAPIVDRSRWLKAALRPSMDRARSSVARAARPA
jgi:hypothetical protein